MKRSSILLALLLSMVFTPARADAQTNAEAEVRAVIQRLFDGMRAADSAAVRTLFHPSARLQSAGTDRAGAPVLHLDSINSFVTGIGGTHPQYDERIANVVVQVDGNLAQAWMDYTFYLDGRKLHCGVDAMQLFRTAEGWKFIQLADTRRRTECPDLPGA
jgi:hypothetical protein